MRMSTSVHIYLQTLTVLHVAVLASMSCTVIVMMVTAARKARETKCEPEPVPNFTKSHAAHKTVKSFLYVNRIDECYKHNVLNFKLAVSSEMQGFN